MYDFSKKYEKENFDKFLVNFLPKDIVFINKDLKLNKSFKFFEKCKLVAEVKSLKDLKIIEIKHNATEKSRITISKDLFKILSFFSYSNALIITYCENEKNYRFSFITSKLEWITDSKIKKKFSNPKRFSFLLGPNAKIHTATKQLIRLGKLQDFNDLKNRFNIEIINDEFFNHYKNLYFYLNKYLNEDKIFSNFAKKKNLEIHTFAKKLLGQIVFCYFLQKKGWLGVNKNKNFGTGSINFLRDQFEKIKSENKNFFNDFLEYFFYDGLNKENKDDYIKNIDCRVPFIGGGLFEYVEGYNWKKETLNIPNKTFSNKEETGILDIFDLYNFTVDENEDFDVEISVDPEMLGRVFENLLEDNIRKEGGSFYTPKTIVKYMCESTLTNYVKQKTKNIITHREIENFVIYKKIDNTIKKNASLLDEILENLKICDPAIGSGAFAVGFVNLISNLRLNLKDYINRKYKNSSYYFKRNCIQNSIYGVDIENSAVEIAKLRLWLSLIVDEEDYSKTEPLPNLDYKIMQGDSLIDEFYGHKFKINQDKNTQYNLYEKPDEIQKLVNEVGSLQDRFINLKQYSKRIDTKKKVDQLLLKIFTKLKSNLIKFDINKNIINKVFESKKKDFFCWGLFFADIFYKKKGFDIIIANPPYVEFKVIDQDYKKKLKEYNSAKGKYDLYVIFTEKCLKLINHDGFVCLIQPTSFLKKDLGKNLRNFIKIKYQIISIHDFADIQIFQSATNYTGIFHLKLKNSNNYNFDFHQYLNKEDNIQKSELFETSLHKKKDENFKNYVVLNSSDLNDDVWNFQTQEIKQKLNLINKQNPFLKNFCESIFQGISSGKDEVFYINEQILNEYKIEKKILKKILKGKDIKSYSINWGGNYVIYPYDSNSNVINEDSLKRDFPNTYKYLIDNKSNLEGRKYFDNSRKLWFELWNQRNPKKFKKMRIVVPDISSKCNFALTDEFYGNTTTYHLLPKNESKNHIKILLALLNTDVIDYYFKKITTPQRGGYFRYKTKFLEKIPINENFFNHSEIIDMVDKLLLNYNSNSTKVIDEENKKILKNINKFASKLYNISINDS